MPDELAVVHTSGELAPINQIDHAQAVVQAYSDWATVLMRVVEDRGLFSTINGKRFLVFEAWQLIASFDGASVDTSDVEPIKENGETIGYSCRAKVVKDGVAIAAGASVGFIEGSFITLGRTGRDKDRAVYSAVQTWAGSKACRMKYSTVATLAGYQPTTEEEMVERHADPPAPHQEAAPQRSNPSIHFCEKHNTEFFMRGNMAGFAHPPEDRQKRRYAGMVGTKWCNEEDAMKVPTKPAIDLPVQPGSFETAVATAAELAVEPDDDLVDPDEEAYEDSPFDRGEV